MSIDLGRYPFRGDFHSQIETDLIFTDIYPQQSQRDVSIHIQEDLLYDFSAENVGYIYLQAKGHGRIRLDYGEWLNEIYDCEDEELPDWYETPYDIFEINSDEFCLFISGGRRAFRFLRLSKLDGDIEIKNLMLKAVEARNSMEGSFHCSNTKLNKIYEISKRTTRLCMQKYLEDGIKRDGLCWISDAFVQAMCDYATFGNSVVVRNSLLYFLQSMRYDGWMPTNATIGGAHQHPQNIAYMFDYVGGKMPEDIPDFFEGCGEIYYIMYHADLISMIYEYYLFTHDKNFVEQIWTYIQKTIAFLMDVNEEFIAKSLMPRAEYKSRKLIDNFCDIGGATCTLIYGLKNYLKLCKVVDDMDLLPNATNAIDKFSQIALRYMDEQKRVWRLDGLLKENINI